MAVRTGAERTSGQQVVILVLLGISALMSLAYAGVSIDIFVERTTTIVVLGLGLAAATLLYWRACLRAVRDRASPWALGVSAPIVAAPVILAIVFPQRPAS